MARHRSSPATTDDDIIAYYLLTMIARAFSSMPGLASGIARSIRNGEIKKFLIQPVDMIGFLLLSRIAHKLVYYAVALLPFALVFFLCRGLLPGWPDAGTWLAFVASLVMAFLLGFFLEATLGMIGFWLLEVSSLLFVYMLFSFFLSGHMFPLDMLDGVTVAGNVTWWRRRSHPAAAIPGLLSRRPCSWARSRAPNSCTALWIELAWVVFFIVALPRGFQSRPAALSARSADDLEAMPMTVSRPCLLLASSSRSPATAWCAT